ncbi:MAG: hypothetical protein PHU44_14200 [Syntrophales bacterium]|nr:hypothetical protein [Syntrophales bacterium]
MNANTTPHCPIPNIGPCVEERCNFWDEEAGCTGVGVAFAADPSLDEITFIENENHE